MDRQTDTETLTDKRKKDTTQVSDVVMCMLTITNMATRQTFSGLHMPSFTFSESAMVEIMQKKTDH
jgi:hypothetical protein